MHGRILHPMDTQRRDRQARWCLPWRLAAVIALGLTLANSSAVQAKTFHCGAGDVQCLIDAINTANANGQKNTIRLQAGTYTLTAINNGTGSNTNGLPVITSGLTITGRGAETTIIERDTSAPPFRLLEVAGTGTLSLKELTLRGGGTGTLFGGGIWNDGGTVTLINCALTHNTASGGGGIWNTGTMRLTNCTLAHNTANGSGGGGILNFGTMKLTNCILTTNQAVPNSPGGGIDNSGTITLTNCTLTGNVAEHQGGGIFNTGTMRLTNCALTDNTTNLGGGGIYNVLGAVALTNCTLTGNRANAGGGVFNGSGTMTLTNCTLTDNVAEQQGRSGGGGIYIISGSATLQNTILALNTAPNVSPPSDDCFGGVTSLDNNLIGDPTGCTITLVPSDLTGDPGLDAFTDNGRPGNGHFPLLPTSQAIDAGSDAVCPRTDQLGRRRIGPCDIGAIEFRHRDDRQHDKEDDHRDEEDDQHDGDPATAAH